MLGHLLIGRRDAVFVDEGLELMEGGFRFAPAPILQRRTAQIPTSTVLYY